MYPTKYFSHLVFEQDIEDVLRLKMFIQRQEMLAPKRVIFIHVCTPQHPPHTHT